MNLQQIVTLSKEELYNVSKVKLNILPDVGSLYQYFARNVADEIKQNNTQRKPTRIILPVGPTPQYRILAEISNKEKISWKNVDTFNMDEYLDWQGRPISLDHPMSFEGFMRKNFFDLLDKEIRILEHHIHFPHPFRIDEISKRIKAVGGIDTCYGGIGYHGHIAFNEPSINRWYRLSKEKFRDSLTRVIQLAPDTVVINSVGGAGGNFSMIPPMAVTIGMKDILCSKRIRLYCDGGDWQKTIFRIACLGKTSVEYPVTFVQEHPDCVINVDSYTADPPKSGPK